MSIDNIKINYEAMISINQQGYAKIIDHTSFNNSNRKEILFSRQVRKIKSG